MEVLLLSPLANLPKPVPPGFFTKAALTRPRRARGYDPRPMALLITFVLVTALTAGAIGAAVAAGTTTGVVVALVIHLLGTVIVLGITFGALGADGAD